MACFSSGSAAITRVGRGREFYAKACELSRLDRCCLIDGASAGRLSGTARDGGPQRLACLRATLHRRPVGSKFSPVQVRYLNSATIAEQQRPEPAPNFVPRAASWCGDRARLGSRLPRGDPEPADPVGRARGIRTVCAAKWLAHVTSHAPDGRGLGRRASLSAGWQLRLPLRISTRDFTSARHWIATAMPNGRCRMHGGRSAGAPRGERNGNWARRVLNPGGASRAAKAARADPGDAHYYGRIAAIETRSREPQFTMPDDLP